jgi:hypothetical protein
MLLEWPEEKRLVSIAGLGEKGGVGPVADVSLLGHDGEVRWGQDKEFRGQLRIILPETLPNEHAPAFRIRFEA